LILCYARARLSPNDCRIKTGCPAIPGGDYISPPNTSAAALAEPGAAGEDASKVARLEEHRHAAD